MLTSALCFVPYNLMEKTMAKSTRRNFLKTAGVLGAGAAIGLGASSVTAPAKSVKAQSATPLAGKITITLTPIGPIHTYNAPTVSGLVTTHIIELSNSLVVVDTQLLRPFGAEAAAYAASLGKPIDRVILTHEHPDHWYGAENFDAPFVATPTTVANVTAAIEDGSARANADGFGPAAPVELRAPVVGVSEGTTIIDGVAFQISTVEGAEAVEQLVIRIPEARTAILQDLMYNAVYFFPGLNRLAWISALDELRKSLKADGYQTILAGHGVPTTVGSLDEGIEFLDFVETQFNTLPSGEAVAEAARSRYPSYEGDVLLTFYPIFFGGGSE